MAGPMHLPMLLLAAMGAGAALAQPRSDPAELQPPPYWADRWRGWHFYEAPLSETEALPRASTTPTTPAAPTAPERPAELIAFERLQKALEERRHIAIMRPTETNVRRYMELEMQVVTQASTFADMAQRVAWATPALDPTLQGRPVNATALQVFEQAQQGQRAAVVAGLAHDHVLLFFFRSDCPYCHAFAPILQAFGQRHGLRIEAVSLDGGPLPGFPAARPDNGIATALQVGQVPALFLAHPQAGTLVPIGFGVLSDAQLLERIATVAAPEIQAPQAPQMRLPGPTRPLALP
jgi:conjugal transfer pilus assembly protein TraF